MQNVSVQFYLRTILCTRAIFYAANLTATRFIYVKTTAFLLDSNILIYSKNSIRPEKYELQKQYIIESNINKMQFLMMINFLIESMVI